MKTKMFLGLILLATALRLPAATNDLTSQLQQGLFDEEANRNLNAAITDYQALASQFDRDRQVAATAIYRLGECYRKFGQTNDAVVQYQRLIREFADEKDLVMLSRQNLTGLGAESPPATAQRLEGIANRVPPEFKATATTDATAEAAMLAGQLAGLDQLKDDPEKRARAVLAIFPDDDLKNMLLHLPMLQDQIIAIADTNRVFHTESFARAIGPGPKEDLLDLNFQFPTNRIEGVTMAREEWRKQMDAIALRVDFIISLQQARLQALQAGAGMAVGNSGSPNAATATVNSIPDLEGAEILSIQQMIQNSPDLINAPGENNLTPLAKAAANGWLKVAAYLLDHGADVNARDASALIEAVRAGNRAMVELLLGRRADVNAEGSGDPLAIAAGKGFPAVVEVLLTNHAEVNAPDNSGYTPLLRAVAARQVKIAQMLLAAGANPNVQNHEGRTPLSYAAESDSPEIVKLLLDAKADPNGGKLDAPLLFAIYRKDQASVELLLKAGANSNGSSSVDAPIRQARQNYSQTTPLFLAVSMDQLPLVQLLLKFKADPNEAQPSGVPLAFSALQQPEILKALLEGGANATAHERVGLENVYQGPPLLNMAVLNTNAAAIELLLAHGANPNAPDGLGMTPLHMAAHALADPNIFEILLAAKADPNVRNHYGKTPLDLLKATAGLSSSPGPSGIQTIENNSPDQIALAGQLVSLLRQHGALDHLPDWDHLTVSRASTGYSQPVFAKGTNDWNQFSLLELIYKCTPIDERFGFDGLPFADLAHLVVVRPGPHGLPSKRFEVNLLTATNELDCTKDLPLEFGDVIEIPEREHTLAETVKYLSDNQLMAILNYLRSKAGSAKLTVTGGQSVELPLQPMYSQIGLVLDQTDAKRALTSNSDLSRIKVTRHDIKTGNTSEWVMDCSRINPDRRNHPNNNVPDLVLRDGDVIEVPEKP